MLGGLWGFVALLTAEVPSSVVWMSAIVCRSRHHLAYDVSHYSLRPDEASSNVNYACVIGKDVYEINDFMIMGLQAVMCSVVAVGYPIWRLPAATELKKVVRCQP